MTRRITIASITAIAVSAWIAASAQAVLIAGWDFSQGTPGGSLGSPLSANYSSLDPTNNAGFESSMFGSATFSGDPVIATAGQGQNCKRAYKAGNPKFGAQAPKGCTSANTSGPVNSNREWDGIQPGETSFDALTVLRAEGQSPANPVALESPGNSSVVFMADLGAPGAAATGWTLSFGGKTVSGGGEHPYPHRGGEVRCEPSCSSLVNIEYSADGVSYSSVGSVNLTPEDAPYSVPLAASGSKAYVRLSFDPSNGTPLIDNVAITALPEPGVTVLLVAGVLGLVALPRRGRRD